MPPPRPARSAPSRATPRRSAGAAAARAPFRHERAWVAALIALHVVLATWGAVRNSVTFDENFHLPSGVMIAARGELRVSAVNPPLVKGLCGAAALAAGARLPAEAALRDGEQGVVGESFMRANADRYQRVFVAGRLVIVALAALLGLLVWRAARRLGGPRAGVLALAFYALAPEALAHAGLVTLDLATALAWLATAYAGAMFFRTGRWGWWWALAGAVSFAFLVRFTALLLGPVLLALAVLAVARGRARHPARVWIGLALLAPVVVVALDLGYLGRVSLEPLRAWHFDSHLFRSLQAAAPWLRLPLPGTWVAGMDRQLIESQSGVTPAYVLGRLLPRAVWWYFPLAFLFKWPLGFLGALAARAARALASWRAPGSRPRAAGRRGRADFVAVGALTVLGTGMFLGNLDIGIRYLFPLLPFLCVWLGGLAAARVPGPPRAARAWAVAGLALALLQGVETGLAAPWYLPFYNGPSGGPGGGDRLVNDSNVDWGQGLVALRDELAMRGIGKVYLAYHGTTDPGVYGIDYVPYLGGPVGAESDWMAVSSYFYVGLTQRMMTSRGRTPAVQIDFHPLWSMRPVARPARCMYLFRLPPRR
jgi:hypothetical protein